MTNDELEIELKTIFRCHGDCDLADGLRKRSPEELTHTLCAAIQEDKPQVVDFVLGLGADVNGSLEGTSPLCFAAHEGKLSFVKKLVSVGAELDKSSNRSRTPLFHAANSGELEVVKWLVSQVQT
jgi:ankyrin repeat protein